MLRRRRRRRGIPLYVVLVVVTCGIVWSVWRLDQLHGDAAVDTARNVTPPNNETRHSCNAFEARRRAMRAEPPLKVESGFASIDRHASLAAYSETRLAAGCPVNFTLATQATPERLWMLGWICRRWEGPIVIAVYTDHRSVVRKDPACGDRVDYRIMSAPEHVFKKHNLYPVNKLRNLAISRVRTSHFLLCDIDLWPDAWLFQRLTSLAATDLFRDPKLALVVPAFSREVKTECSSSTAASDSQAKYRMEECHKEARDMPRDFGRLKTCIIDKECHIFDRFNQDGHGTTDYRAWLRQDGVRRVSCFLSNRYEPYVVLQRTPDLPRFEEQFTGYGKNKIQNLVHLRYSGWRFAVLPRSFLVHFPHHKSAARLEWENKDAEQQQQVDVSSNPDLQHRAHMDRVYRKFLDALIAVYGSPGDRPNVTRICH